MRDKILFTITVEVDPITTLPEEKEGYIVSARADSHGEITGEQAETIAYSVIRTLMKASIADPSGRMLKGPSRGIESFMNEKGGN